jgi:GT2 family glycosyltransferase/glycosyltransferase involved in cell wall biosynthesis
MNIACVTLTYDSADLTARLLRSLERQTDRDLQVFVVDNDSDADDRERLEGVTAAMTLPVEVIVSPTNLGFSGGNNLGIRRALADGAEWIVLLNNDTEVDPDFVATLRATLADRDGIVGLPMEEAGAVVRAGRRRWLALTLDHHTGPDDASDAYAVGGAMAVHRTVFERVGLLDERYFLYFEDVDFSARATRAGIPLHFPAVPVLRHAVSASTAKLGAPLLARYHARNAIHFNKKNGPMRVRVALMPWVVMLAARELVKLVIGRDRRRARAVLSGITDARKQRWGEIDQRVTIAIECESLEGQTWGVGRIVAKLIEALGDREAVRRQFRITLYSNGPLPDSVHYDERLFTSSPVGLPARLGPSARSSFSLYYFLLLPVALRRDRPRAVFYPSYMLPFGAPSGSLVLLTDDVFREAKDPGLSWRHRVLYRIFSLGWAKARATRVMTLSESSAEHLEARGIEASRIVVNPPAVDRPRTDVPAGLATTFLWVGQAFPRRHLREALLAFATITRTEPATFRIVGPDRYPTPTIGALVHAINEKDDRPTVFWDEYVSDDDLAAAYASADAIVYVSATEAFGLPPLEALSYGTPAVLADTPVNRELYGSLAFYVPLPVSEDGIAAAMRASMHDTVRRDEIRAAAASITERYAWGRYSDRFLATMEDLSAS